MAGLWMGRPVTLSQMYGSEVLRPYISVLMDEEAAANKRRAEAKPLPPGPCRNCGAAHRSTHPERRCEYCGAAG